MTEASNARRADFAYALSSSLNAWEPETGPLNHSVSRTKKNEQVALVSFKELLLLPACCSTSDHRHTPAHSTQCAVSCVCLLAYHIYFWLSTLSSRLRLWPLFLLFLPASVPLTVQHLYRLFVIVHIPLSAFRQLRSVLQAIGLGVFSDFSAVRARLRANTASGLRPLQNRRTN